MASPATTAASGKVQHGGSKPKRRRGFWLAVVAAIVACLFLVLFIRFWPFTQKSVLQDLGEASDSKVAAESYHATFLPPGCVLEGVSFRHQGSEFIAIPKLIVAGSYLGILRHHVHRIEAIGARVYIPPIGSHAKYQVQHSRTVVDELVANGAYVEFESSQPHQDHFHFDVHQATLRNVRWDGAIVYHLKFHNPNPPGEASADGTFGAWSDERPENTPFSGRYTLEHADLAYYHGIAGMLSSQGQFYGPLEHLNVNGSTVVPDFEITSSGNKVKLETRFNAYVDAMNGDTFLEHVEAHFGRTNLVAEGGIAHFPGHQGKFTKVRLTVKKGRIEDVLGLFVTGTSPLSGPASLEAQARVPPDVSQFDKKIDLEGTFNIDEGRFSKEATQADVDELSAGARGKNKQSPPLVLTDLSGGVQLHQGIANFSELRFTIPGAKARMHGSYSILNYRINLHGRMRVETKISKTSSGIKSLALKILDPLFKKRKKGEVVPIHIAGTYQKPQFGLDLANQGSPKKE